MAACGGCGASGAGPFCAECGLSLDEIEGQPLVLGASLGVADNVSERRHDPASAKRTGFAFLVMMAIFAFGLISFLGGSEDAANPPEEADQADADQPEETTTTTTTVTTTTEPTSAATATSAALNNITVAPDQSATTTTAESTTTTESPYLLGEPTNWDVVVGAPGALVRVDTETGDSQVIHEGNLFPLINTGNWIVLSDPDAQLYAVKPDDLQPGLQLPEPLSHQITTRAPGYGFVVPSVSDSPDKLWVSGQEGDAYEIDLNSGETVRSLGRDSVYFSPTSPRFTGSFAGGVYVLEPEDAEHQWRRVLDGSIRVEGYGRLLVEQCDDRMQCGSTWFDSTSFQPLTELVAPREDGSSFLLGAGRFTVEGYSSLLDLQTGERHQVAGAQQINPWERNFDVASDGSLTAFVTPNNKLQLHRIGGGYRTVEDVEPVDFAVPVFVLRSVSP